MKKIIMIISTVLIISILILIITTVNKNKIIEKEIKRLETIIELKQEINKEYAYLFKQTENENIDTKTEKENKKIKEKTENIENLTNTVIELQNEKQNIEEKIEEQKKEIERKKEEQRRLEEQRILEEQRRIESTTVKIGNEITYSQYPEYPTGCESIALKILLEYNGVYVSAEDIINKLKKGELPHKIEEKTYGGNPNIEFIGDPRNDFSYGVYNTPIAEVANTFKGGVQNKEGLELEEILNIVSQNRPVMVWTTINNMSSYISKAWIYRPTGEIIYWKSNEHVVVIIGYNEKQVIVSDPYSGTITRYNRETFKENYNYLGKRAVYY